MSELRTATFADIPELQRLIARSVRGLSIGMYSPAQTEAALVHVFGVDTQLVADETYYVIEENAAIVAAGGWSARREVDSLLDPTTDPARIRAFFVHPDWTRRGLARRLFTACESAARARGFHAFELVSTLPGEPLYRALGFTAIEPIPVPMPGNLTLPCLRMRLELDHVS
jgi:GNAT superfamily N-acetyltransferase